MRNLIILGVVILSLTGCYQFQSPPFADKDLKPISETEFGKDVLKAMRKVSVDKESPIADLKKNISSDSKALVINDEFLVMQSKKKGSWELTMLMKNSSHIMFCALGENKDIQVPQSIQVTEKKEMMGTMRTVSGPSEELKQFALKLIETTSKFCLSVPYKSSKMETKMETTTKPWWKFW